MSGPERGAALAGMRLLAPVAAAASVVGAAIVDSGSPGETTVASLGALCWLIWAIRPTIGTLAPVVGSTTLVLIALSGGKLEPSLFMLSVAATVTGMLELSRWRLVLAGVVLVSAPSVASFVVDNELSTATWTAGMILPIALTQVSRRQEMLSLQLAEARAERADQRVAEERRRIARDVHDSVGHGLAAMLLHITGARHVLRRDVESADDALAEAEAVGRRSMLELRRTLGLLRAPDVTAAGPAAPVPDAAQLRLLGVEITGDLPRLDPLVATSMHRVASEALANVRQHASGPPTVARLEIGDDRVVLTIESPADATSPGDAAGTASRGHYGIVGMSERMAAVGGELLAGPTRDGWIVRASAPITGVEATEAAS